MRRFLRLLSQHGAAQLTEQLPLPDDRPSARKSGAPVLVLPLAQPTPRGSSKSPGEM